MRFLLALFVTLSLISPVIPVHADESGPSDQLKPTLDQLIAILEDDSLQGMSNKAKRRSKIMAIISNGFDFREMSRRVLGRAWNDISDEQKDYFVDQMTKLLENVYVGKLETYTGQTVEFVAERVKGKRAQVTTLIEDQGVKLPVHYIMQKEADRWMVYDINIEGVSLIRNYMEQFRSILRTEKYPGLIKIIEDKNKSFLENGTS
ncbi:MAG: ABC transporter substrate-binding protein [Desulfobacterales bacterium]|nr:ABC transporter substrate-binding protein [Deltaproteobacteria bacterium]NNK95837.1 ABC transporter substrate-binding protein [Desulfobacterales bacterium]